LIRRDISKRASEQQGQQKDSNHKRYEEEEDDENDDEEEEKVQPRLKRFRDFQQQTPEEQERQTMHFRMKGTDNYPEFQECKNKER